MSATVAAPSRAARRPVITALPTIQVVPTPAPVRGLIATVVTCAVLFVGALAAVFTMNTAMVGGAYEIQMTQIELNDLAVKRTTLEDKISEVSTTSALREKAGELGLAPATEVRHIDLATGVVTGGNTPSEQ